MQQGLVLVDAGNLLFKKPLLNSNGIGDRSNTTALITAYGIVRAYRHMSYDAVAISSNDLSAGPEFFQQSNEASFPWVAANVTDKDAHLLFSPHIIKKSGGVTIGIIGLTGANWSASEDFVISDWRHALRTEIALLEKSCHILLVLSNLNASENVEMQKDFSQIDIIVTANRRGKNIAPQVSHKKLLIESGGRGKYLGKLDISWQSPDNSPVAQAHEITHQKNRLRLIDVQQSQLERQQETELTEKEKKPVMDYKSYFLPVKPKSSGDKIGQIVQDIKKSITSFNRYRRTGLRQDDPLVRLALQTDEITGPPSCFDCHEKQTEFWKSTRHANAYTTLSRQGESFNLHCLPCHVTAGKITSGSIESELIYLLSLNSDRQTIGCEVCHGPGKQHLLDPGQVAPVRMPAREICIQCHNSERDSNFEYQRKLATIGCPAG
jgi:hypothetical protein